MSLLSRQNKYTGNIAEDLDKVRPEEEAESMSIEKLPSAARAHRTSTIGGRRQLRPKLS